MREKQNVVPLGVTGTIVLLLLVSAGFNLSNVLDGNTYYCPLENTVQQCKTLQSYGVENARCVLYKPESGQAKTDICTSGGERAAWQPISNYIDVEIGKATTIVGALQDCTEEVVEKRVFTFGNESYFDENGTEHIEERITAIQLVNESVPNCKPTGFEINHSNGKTYNIEGSCCGYFEESPYEQYAGLPVISCKEPINNICNPVIQQTSKDKSEYDEAGRIYVISDIAVTPYLVGDYPFFRNNDVQISRLKVKQ